MYRQSEKNLLRGRHLYSAGRPSRWALAHISSIITRAVLPVATCPNRHISISQLFSLWRHTHYDVSRLRRRRRLQRPFSLWRHSRDVICYWAGHSHRYGRTNVRTGTLPRLINKDYYYQWLLWSPYGIGQTIIYAVIIVALWNRPDHYIYGRSM